MSRTLLTCLVLALFQPCFADMWPHWGHGPRFLETKHYDRARYIAPAVVGAGAYGYYNYQHAVYYNNQFDQSYTPYFYGQEPSAYVERWQYVPDCDCQQKVLVPVYDRP